MQYVHNAQEMKSLLSKPPYLKRVHYQFRRGLHFWIFSEKYICHQIHACTCCLHFAPNYEGDVKGVDNSERDFDFARVSRYSY